MKLNFKFFDKHTDIKLWRGALASAVGIFVMMLSFTFIGIANDADIGLILFEALVSGMYLAFVLFQIDNKPKTSPKPVVREYWIFVKDPTRLDVYGPYTKSEAIIETTEFNDSYSGIPEATYIKAKSRREAQLAAREMRK